MNKSNRLLVAAAACFAALLISGTPVSAQVPPSDYTYDPSVNELVGLYSSPAIANSSDYVTGSPSKSVAKTAVIVIFSGAGWANTWSSYLPTDLTYLTTMFNSPYFSELTQYGFSSLYYVNAITDESAQSVTGTFTTAQIEAMINRYLTYKIAVPAGYRPLYFIMVTPNSVDSNQPGAGGEHFTYTAPGGAQVLGAWANTAVGFAHEIAETITDPVVGANYLMDRAFPHPGPSKGEIADAGEEVTDPLPGALDWNDYPVQPYWSQAQGSCVIPVGTPHQAAGPALTSYFDGLSTHVFYVSDRQVHELIGTGNPATWTTDLVVARVPFVRGGAGLTSVWDPVHQAGYVFYTDTNCNVDQLYHSPGQPWTWSSLESAVTADGSLPAGTTAPTVTPQIQGGRGLTSFLDSGDGSVHVVFPSGFDNVYEFKWTPTAGWSSDLVAWETRGWNTQISGLYNGTDHIFYFDTKNHIQDTEWTGSAWQSTDWSAAVGANAAALPGNDAIASSTEYTPGSTSTSDAQVYYIDTNHQVQTITHYADGTYGFTNLSPGTPSASLAGSPVLSCTDVGGLVRLYYFGQDTKVHEIVRTQINTFYDTQTWQTMDTPPAPSGRPYVLPSRLLTSCYDPYYDVAYYFDLSEPLTTETVDSAPIGAGANPGYGWSPTTWTPFLASSSANAPVAFP